MLGKKRRQHDQPINAGSMADIAFLLLIFFLVTTTIVNETGIRVKLPPWDPNVQPKEIIDRNVLNILVNASDQILVEKKEASVETIKETTKRFIMNPQRLLTLPENPRNAIVSLQNDRGTTYRKYVEVYNEVKAAYNELWEEASQLRFRKSYKDLSEVDRKDIRRDIPLVISEADPTDVGAIGSIQ